MKDSHMFRLLLRCRRRLESAALGLSIAGLAACLLAGCASTPPTDEMVDGPAADASAEEAAAPADGRERRLAEHDPLVPVDLEQDERRRRFVLPKRGGRARAGAIDLSQTQYSLAASMAEEIEDADQLSDMVLEFDSSDIAEVIQEFSVILDFQYHIDAGVSGSVNMTLNTQMTLPEAWKLFEHILWTSGCYASRKDGFIHILQFPKMPKERGLFADKEPIPNVEVELIQIMNITADQMKGFIQPFMTDGATATTVQHLNALLIVEAPPNMPKLRVLIDKLDVIGAQQWPQTSIECRNVDVTVVLDELKQVLPVLGFEVSTSEKASGGAVKLIALERMQVLLVAAPIADVLEEVRRWVEVLDREDTGEQERIYFYPVRYNKAEDLSDAVSVFFNAASTAASARTNSTSTSSTNRSTNTQPTSRAGNSPRNTPRQTRQQRSTEKPATIFDVPVTMFADGTHNRLVIRTTPRAYSMLQALLQRLDTPPLQVLIRMSIVEVGLSKETKYGFQYAALNRINEYSLSSNIKNTNTVDPAGDLFGLTFASQGVTGADGVTNPGDVFSFIEAVAGAANTRLIFSPQVVAISDQQAVINVGDSVPVITGDTNDSGGDNITRDVDYRDTGIILTVTPHITANKLVTLELTQEVSDAKEGGVPLNPTITNRKVETAMVVEDGETILLGGMIKTNREVSRFGLPVLKDIPWLGKVFSHKRRTNTRDELLLLITVKVIDLETDFQQIIQRYRSALRALEEDLESDELYNHRDLRME
jgi:general secretion pathway protein D